MTQLRAFIISVVCILGLSPVLAATGWIDYSSEQFAEAQASGKTILVDVYADWCPTCKKQHPILEELKSDERMQDTLFVRVDFDVHKEFLENHKIPRQSTILIFEGQKEIGRSIAETDRDRLRNFVFDAVRN